jgi:hypothetical protein
MRTAKLSILVFTISLLLSACSSAQKGSGEKRISDSEYKSVTEAYTQNKKKYDGFYNRFDASIIFLNTKVQEAVLRRRADYLQWDQNEYLKEREKSFQENSSSTRFFLSFFTPDREQNNLHVPAKSIWKLYLEVDGRRLEGKVRKLTTSPADLQNTFPFFGRFHTPYEVVFEIPTSVAERNPVRLTLTSSQGSAEFDFNP